MPKNRQINTTTKMLGIRWKVEKVKKIPFDKRVYGPDFYLTRDCVFNISYLQMYDIVYVYLCNKSNTTIIVERTTCQLLDYDKNEIQRDTHGKIFSLKKDEEEQVGSCLRELLNLNVDVLIIDLSVNIKEDATENLYGLDPGSKLKEDLKRMLENPVNSDVCLQVGDERIPAHWSILCSRSHYFKKMFDSGMKESLQNSVTFTDMSFSTVKKLIQFLYTGDLVQGDDLQELFDLYYAADKCEVVDLKALCGGDIVSYATTDNVCDIFHLSRRHCDKALQKAAIRFIKSHSDAVFQTESWKTFEVSEPETAELLGFCLKED